MRPSTGPTKVFEEIMRWQDGQRYGSLTINFRGGVITHYSVNYTKLVEGFERDVRSVSQDANLESQ